MFVMQLAEFLHKSIAEVMELSVFEARLWAAYWKVRTNGT
jgi:hypothetical protein